MTATAAPPQSGTAPSPANIQLLQLAGAAWASRCLHVVAQLGVADHIGDAPQSTEALAKATGTRPDALYRVLRLLASLGVFEWKNGAWSHSEASRFLRSDHPGSLRDYVRMLGLPIFWDAYEDMEYSLRTGQPAFAKRHEGGVFAYLAGHPEESRIFDAAMTSKSHRDITAVLPAYDFSQFGTIADIAGGHGHLLAAVLRKYPNARGVLFHLPPVLAGAPKMMDSYGVGDRVELVEGDFFAGIPVKADIYLLKHIIHDWYEDTNQKILRNIRANMPDDGKVLIIEAVVPEGNEPHFSKIIDLEMLISPGGIERTPSEFEKLLSDSGFKMTRIIPTQGMMSIVEAVKQ